MGFKRAGNSNVPAGTAASCLRYAGSTERSAGRLGFPAPLRQDELGVAVRLLASLEDQVAGRLESDAVETVRHRPIQRIAFILSIHHHRHPLQRLHHLVLADDALM